MLKIITLKVVQNKKKCITSKRTFIVTVATYNAKCYLTQMLG